MKLDREKMSAPFDEWINSIYIRAQELEPNYIIVTAHFSKDTPYGPIDPNNGMNMSVSTIWKEQPPEPIFIKFGGACQPKDCTIWGCLKRLFKRNNYVG